jgi:hypothetical protein
MDNNELLLLEMRKKKTNHVLHLLLTLITMGLWVLVWIIMSHSNSRYNKKLGEPEEKTSIVTLLVLALIVGIVGMMLI